MPSASYVVMRDFGAADLALRWMDQGADQFFRPVDLKVRRRHNQQCGTSGREPIRRLRPRRRISLEGQSAICVPEHGPRATQNIEEHRSNVDVCTTRQFCDATAPRVRKSIVRSFYLRKLRFYVLRIFYVTYIIYLV